MTIQHLSFSLTTDDPADLRHRTKHMLKALVPDDDDLFRFLHLDVEDGQTLREQLDAFAKEATNSCRNILLINGHGVDGKLQVKKLGHIGLIERYQAFATEVKVMESFVSGIEHRNLKHTGDCYMETRITTSLIDLGRRELDEVMQRLNDKGIFYHNTEAMEVTDNVSGSTSRVPIRKVVFHKESTKKAHEPQFIEIDEMLQLIDKSVISEFKKCDREIQNYNRLCDDIQVVFACCFSKQQAYVPRAVDHTCLGNFEDQTLNLKTDDSAIHIELNLHLLDVLQDYHTEDMNKTHPEGMEVDLAVDE